MVQENVCMARADDCSDPRTSIHVVVQRPLARQVARDPGAVPQEHQAQLAQVGFKGQLVGACAFIAPAVAWQCSTSTG